MRADIEVRADGAARTCAPLSENQRVSERRKGCEFEIRVVRTEQTFERIQASIGPE